MDLENLLQQPEVDLTLFDFHLFSNIATNTHALTIGSAQFAYSPQTIQTQSYPLLIDRAQRAYLQQLDKDLTGLYEYVDIMRDIEEFFSMSTATSIALVKLYYLPRALIRGKSLQQYFKSEIINQSQSLLLVRKVQEIFERGEVLLQEYLPESAHRATILKDAHDLTCKHRQFVATREKIAHRDAEIFSLLYPTISLQRPLAQ